MLTIKSDGSVQLTRGDSADLEINITQLDNNAPYEMRATDSLLLSLKKNPKDATYALLKTTTGSNLIHISPADTAGMAFGKYKYDVELRTAAGGVYTVIENKDFELTVEVTCPDAQCV